MLEASKQENKVIIIALRFLAIVALLYNAWIIFRVIDDWFGLVVAILSLVLLPITTFIMPFIMLIVPTSAAGPFALWPAVAFVGILEWLAKKLNGSLTFY